MLRRRRAMLALAAAGSCLPFSAAAQQRAKLPRVGWLALNNASQLERLGRTEQAVRHLEEMYAAVDDPDTRRQIVERIALLRDEAFAEAFQQTTDEVESRREREFPYVPPTFYLLLGPRIPELGPESPGLPPRPAPSAPADAGGSD